MRKVQQRGRTVNSDTPRNPVGFPDRDDRAAWETAQDAMKGVVAAIINRLPWAEEDEREALLMFRARVLAEMRLLEPTDIGVISRLVREYLALANKIRQGRFLEVLLKTTTKL